MAEQIVLLPCNGMSARGQIAARVAQMVHESVPEIKVVDIVPLMAKVPDEVQILQSATVVYGIAGCSHQCDRAACRQLLGKEPTDSYLIGDALRPDVHEMADTTDDEVKRCALEISSRVIGKITTDA